MADDKKKDKGDKAAKGEGKPDSGSSGGGGGGDDKAAKRNAAAAAGKAKQKAAKENQLKIAEEGEVARTAPARLRTRYAKEIAPALQKQFNYSSAMEVPRLVKITINMGLGEAVQNPKIMDSAVDELSAIAGQKPVVTRAKKSIATFKLREGQKIGAMVTLRRDRMFEFFDRLVTLALPRVRDFKGISPRSFDGRGNFSMGVREQIIFPEINYERLDKIKGLNISIVTTAKTDDEGRALLTALGMPFRS